MRREKTVPAKTTRPPEAGAALSARERLLKVASELFYRQGIRPVGVDEIVDKADVAKMSLYRSFSSKDALAAAYLEAVDRRYWRAWEETLERHRGEPREQLRALFRDLAKRAMRGDWRGCPFTNAATEFPEKEHPVRKLAEAHKHELRRRLRHLARAVGARRPSILADQLVLLFEGVYSSAQTFGDGGPAGTVIAAAEALLAAQLEQS